MSETDSPKPEDPLREELVKKAKAAGVYVHYTWDAERIEQELAKAAAPSDTDGADVEALQAELSATKEQLAAAQAELEGVKTELATAQTAVSAQQEELLNLNQALAAAQAAQPVAAAQSAAQVDRPAPPTLPVEVDPADDQPVTVRITKKGAGKVSDGEGGNLDWEDEIELPRSVAQGLEDKGFGEIRE